MKYTTDDYKVLVWLLLACLAIVLTHSYPDHDEDSSCVWDPFQGSDCN